MAYENDLYSLGEQQGYSIDPRLAYAQSNLKTVDSNIKRLRTETSTNVSDRDYALKLKELKAGEEERKNILLNIEAGKQYDGLDDEEKSSLAAMNPDNYPDDPIMQRKIKYAQQDQYKSNVLKTGSKIAKSNADKGLEYSTYGLHSRNEDIANHMYNQLYNHWEDVRIQSRNIEQLVNDAKENYDKKYVDELEQKRIAAKKAGNVEEAMMYDDMIQNTKMKPMNDILSQQLPILENLFEQASSTQPQMYSLIDPKILDKEFSDQQFILKDSQREKRLKAEGGESLPDYIANQFGDKDKVKRLTAEEHSMILESIKQKHLKQFNNQAEKDLFNLEFDMYVLYNHLHDQNGNLSPYAIKQDSKVMEEMFKAIDGYKNGDTEITKNYGLSSKDIEAITGPLSEKYADAAEHFLKEAAKKDIDYKSNFFTGAGAGIKNELTTLGGFGDIGKQAKFKDASLKAASGDALSPDEIMLLAAYGYNQSIDSLDNGIMYDIGEGVGHMLPYMITYGATNAIAKSALKKLAGVTFKSMAEAGSFGAYVGHNAPRYAAKALLQTAMSPQMYMNSYYQKRGGQVAINDNMDIQTFGQQERGQAIRNAFVETFAEIYSEGAGSEFKFATRPLGKGAKYVGSKVIGKTATAWVENVVSKLRPKGFLKASKFVEKEAPFLEKYFNLGNMFEEYGEEKFNDLINIAFQKDDNQNLKSFFDARQNIVTAGVVSVFGGATSVLQGGVSSISNTIRNNRNNGMTEVMDGKIKIPTSIYNEYRRRMAAAAHSPSLQSQVVAEIIDQVNKSDKLTDEEKSNFGQFAAIAGIVSQATSTTQKRSEQKEVETIFAKKGADATIEEYQKQVDTEQNRLTKLAEKLGENENTSSNEDIRAQRKVLSDARKKLNYAKGLKTSAETKKKNKESQKTQSQGSVSKYDEAVKILDEYNRKVSDGEIELKDRRKAKKQVDEEISKLGFTIDKDKKFSENIGFDELNDNLSGNEFHIRTYLNDENYGFNAVFKEKTKDGYVFEKDGKQFIIPERNSFDLYGTKESNQVNESHFQQTGQRNIKNKYKGKIIYATPTSGKSFAARYNDDVIDGDDLMYDEAVKAGITTIPGKKNQKITADNIGLLYYEANKRNDPKLNKLIENVRNRIKQEKAAGNTVLIGSQYFSDMADTYISTPYADQISERSKEEDRKNRNNITPSKAEQIISKEKKSDVKLEKGKFISDEIFDSPVRMSKKDSFDSARLNKMKAKKMNKFIRKLQRATDLPVRIYYSKKDGLSATVTTDRNGNPVIAINIANAKMSDGWHELSHPILIGLRKTNPEAFNDIWDQLKQSEEWAEIVKLAEDKVLKLYNQNELITPEDYKEEVLATAIGYIVSRKNENKTVSDKLRDFYDDVIQFIKGIFGISTSIDKINTIEDLLDAVESKSGRIRVAKFVSEDKYSKFDFFQSVSEFDKKIEAYKASQAYKDALKNLGIDNKNDELMHILGAAFMKGKLIGVQTLQKYGKWLYDDKQYVEAAVLQAMNAFNAERIHDLLGPEEAERWRELAESQYFRIFNTFKKDIAEDELNMNVDDMAGVTETSDQKINKLRKAFSKIFDVISDTKGYNRDDVERAIYKIFSIESTMPISSDFAIIHNEQSFHETVGRWASGDDLYSSIANVIFDQISFDQFVSMRNFYSNVFLVERIGIRTRNEAPNTNTIKLSTFYSQNKLDKLGDIVKKFENHLGNRKKINKQNLNRIYDSMSKFITDLYFKSQSGTESYTPSTVITINTLTFDNKGNLQEVRATKSIMDHSIHYLSMITGISEFAWEQYFRDPQSNEVIYLYSDRKGENKIPENKTLYDLADQKLYNKLGSKYQPWIAPRLLYVLDKKFKETQHHQVNKMTYEFFSAKADKGLSNLDKLARAQNNDEIELSGRSVKWNRFSSFIQNSDLMQSILGLKEKIAAKDKSNPITKYYIENNKQLRHSIFQGTYDISTKTGVEVANMTTTEYWDALIQFFMDGENGYMQTIGQFADKDSQHMIEVPKRKLTDHTRELTKSILEKDGESYEDNILFLQKIVGKMSYSEQVNAGYKSTRELAEHFLINFVLNKNETNKIFFGEEANYKNFIDMVKRGGSTISPGYTVATNIEDGMEDTFSHVVINDLMIADELGLSPERFDGISFMSGKMAEQLQVSMGSIFSRADEFGPLNSVKAIYSAIKNGKRALTKTNVVSIDVLAETFGAESIYGKLKAWMDKNGIDQVSFPSGTKMNESGQVIDLIKRNDDGTIEFNDVSVDPNAEENRRETKNFFIQQDLRHQIIPTKENQASQLWTNILTFDNPKFVKLQKELMKINMEIFHVFYGNLSDEAVIRQLVTERLDSEKDEALIKALDDGRSLKDPEIINKVYSELANIISKELVKFPIPRVATQEIPDAEAKLLGLRKDAKGNVLLPEIAVNIPGIRYAKEFDTKERAEAELLNNIGLYPDLSESDFLTPQLWQIYQDEITGKWIVPGEPIVSTRIPADDLHSHTVARARHRIKTGNFTMLDHESQARSGSDFDGDQRYNWVLSHDENKRIILNNDFSESKNRYDGYMNRMLIEMRFEYENPKNWDKIRAAIDTHAFDKFIPENKQNYSWSSVKAHEDARKNNMSGVMMKGIVTNITTAYSYMQAYADPGTIAADPWGNIKWALGIFLNLSFDNAKDPKIERMGFNEVTAKDFVWYIISNKNVINAQDKESQLSAIMDAIGQAVRLYNTPEGKAYIESVRLNNSTRGGETTGQIMKRLRENMNPKVMEYIQTNWEGAKLLQKFKDYQSLTEDVSTTMDDITFLKNVLIPEFQNNDYIYSSKGKSPFKQKIGIKKLKTHITLLDKIDDIMKIIRSFSSNLFPEDSLYADKTLKSTFKDKPRTDKTYFKLFYKLIKTAAYNIALFRMEFPEKIGSPNMVKASSIVMDNYDKHSLADMLAVAIDKTSSAIYDDTDYKYAGNKFLEALQVVRPDKGIPKISVRKEFINNLSNAEIELIKQDFSKLSRKAQVMFLAYQMHTNQTSVSLNAESYYTLMSDEIRKEFNDQLNLVTLGMNKRMGIIPGATADMKNTISELNSENINRSIRNIIENYRNLVIKIDDNNNEHDQDARKNCKG